MKISQIFDKPKIIGVCGNVNTGKSMLLYNILSELAEKHSFSLFTYGLKLNFKGAKEIFSVQELEDISNSLVIVDELSNLFDLDNRKQKKIIEKCLRLLHHNNNIIVLCGTPENFKKFISAKLDVVLIKKTTLNDCINGSKLKNIIMNYEGNERGSALLNLAVDEALVFDGHYNKIKLNYLKEYDSKSRNCAIFVPKSVHKNKLCKNVEK